MRDILFRGKDKQTGNWVYGYLSYSEHGETYYIGVEEIMTPVIPDTIGQFTELLDKNGDRIFEGDILDYEGEFFTVFYDMKEAGYAVRHNDGSEHYLEEISVESIISNK